METLRFNVFIMFLQMYKNMFLNVFYLQMNVFNIYGYNNSRDVHPCYIVLRPVSQCQVSRFQSHPKIIYLNSYFSKAASLP